MDFIAVSTQRQLGGCMVDGPSAGIGTVAPGVVQEQPGKTVLVIDDDPLLVVVLQKILESEGYSACTATSGSEGVELYRARNPDAVLLDVNMPTMDGLTTLEE